MTSRRALIDKLRLRSDLSVEEHADHWLLRIPKGTLACEVEIPKEVFEWFASVKRLEDKEEVWSDWMDHYGARDEELESEMAESISAFVQRVVHFELKLPLSIYEEEA